MKKITREEEIYLEQRAQVENVTDIRDYRQLVGEHACVMIDMLNAMAKQPIRISSIAHIGARAQQNVSEWHKMIASDVHGHDYDQKSIHGVLDKATDDLMDFMQAGKPEQERSFLERQHKVIGGTLGHFCALSGRWKKHYDKVAHEEVASRIQRRWTRYVRSLLDFTRVVQKATQSRQAVPEGKLYQHGTFVLLHAQALGQAWNEWIE